MIKIYSRVFLLSTICSICSVEPGYSYGFEDDYEIYCTLANYLLRGQQFKEDDGVLPDEVRNKYIRKPVVFGVDDHLNLFDIKQQEAKPQFLVRDTAEDISIEDAILNSKEDPEIEFHYRATIIHRKLSRELRRHKKPMRPINFKTTPCFLIFRNRQSDLFACNKNTY